jgi:glycosyltransferase involved in cell wall biosynthesis
MFSVIIPAYHPDYKLPWLIDELYKKNLKNIMVVNDGSGPESEKIFASIEKLTVVLKHEKNQGKGAAIKTALAYIAGQSEATKGIVIIDADGQHSPEDALHLLNKVQEGCSGLILGVRKFDHKIPLRSLFGNTVTKLVFYLCSGKWVSDTQTGLRAFPYDMVNKLSDIEGDRYEYEMNVLLACAKEGVPITEVPITTIYHDKSNSCSHFRTIRDSARIYGNLLKFSGASFLCFLLDYALFFPMVWLFGLRLGEKVALICGNVVARLFSASVNYYLNSTFVFHCTQSRKKSILSYVLLAVMILYLNSLILYFFHDYLGMDKALAKLLAEGILFAISFCVQRFVIFGKKIEEAGAVL